MEAVLSRKKMTTEPHQPRLPKFEYTWTFGNTLILIGMLAGGVGVYADISASIRLQHQAIQQYRDSLLELRAMTTNNDARIRSLELGASRIEEKLLNINATLGRIETTLTNGSKK